ncbi:DUF4476 domain-containing protein [Hymenobacter crusticola]|uniref:DUF4476 domain-containing protein n=1 Tax=Hymenobacter crusticola TaxID=1770526 RepID=A0A243W740_9BACT|nr:DUF4476 domain-containing protein [Hymenobacter crusticola]OUJ70221.1 hypothetical protein BXP70_25000 [Hymenobacter crusticola]
MKKTLLLCLSTLLLLSFRGMAAPATVNFASERGLPFQLVFDGRPLLRTSASRVRIDRLTPGFHWAEFRIPTAFGGAVNYRTRLFLDPGLETSFVLLARSGYPPVLRKVAAVPIRTGGFYPPNSPGYPGGTYNDPGYGASPDGSGRNDSGVNNEGGYSGPANPIPGPNGPDPNYPNTPNNYPSAPAPAPYPNNGSGTYYQAMSAADVDGLLQFLQKKSFDDNKLPVIKQALGESLVQSADLARLMQTLSFESNRLELAKYAYARVADRQNFYRVYDALQYTASSRELQDFVSQQRGQ